MYKDGFVISKNDARFQEIFVSIHLRKSLNCMLESYWYNFCVENLKLYCAM